MPETATAADIKKLVNDSSSRIGPNLTHSLNAQLGSILPSIPQLKGTDTSKITKALAESTSQGVLKDAGHIAKAEDISRFIAEQIADHIEASKEINPELADIDFKGIYKQINKSAEAIAKEHFQSLEGHAALQSISDTLDLANKTARQDDFVVEEADNFAKEEHPADAAETAQNLKQHTNDISSKYHDEFVNQVPLLFGKPLTIEQVNQAKDYAYKRAYAAIEANLQQTSEYKEHLRDFSQNVMPMLGYKPLSPKEAEELGAGSADPSLTAFTHKTKFSAKGVGLAMASSPRVQQEAFYTLLAHNRDQFEQDYKQVSGHVKQLHASRDSLDQDQRLQYIHARQRLAILRNARNFIKNNPGKVQTYTDTFQAMEAGYGASWAGRASRATLNVFSRRVPGVHMPVMSKQVRDSFMSRRFFGGLAFRKGRALTAAKGAGQLAKGAKMANPELMVADKAFGWGKKFVAANLLGLFGLGMYFLALGKAVFTGFIIGAATGGTLGAIGGGIIGFQIGVALAPFTFGLSIPAFTILGVAVGGAAGAFLGGVVGGFIAYGLHAGGATAITTGAGVGVGSVAGAVVGGVIGATLLGWIPVIGAPLGALLGAMIGAYVGAAVGGYLGYLYGKYVVGTLGAQGAGAATGAAIGFAVGGPVGAVVGAGLGWFITGGWTKVSNFLAGVFGTTSVSSGFFNGLAAASAAVWGGAAGIGGAILGGITGVGSAIWSGLSGIGVSATTAAAPVVASVGVITTVGLLGGTITAATFFNPEPGTAQFVGGDNDFYTITKLARPLILENADLSSNPDITFIITLIVKDTDLTNISLADTLTVTGEGVNLSIPTDVDGNNISPPCDWVNGDNLDAHDTWRCEFVIRAGSTWADTLVSNVIRVQATPVGETSPTIDSATATVLIGEPSIVCDVFDIQGPWSPVELANIDGVCAELARSGTITTLIQNAGTVTLRKVGAGSLGAGVCGIAVSLTEVQIGCDLLEENLAKYVIIHELGHIIGNNNGSVYSDYLSNPAFSSEGLVPTYPFPPSAITWCGGNAGCESFAEMIADYVIAERYNFLARGWSGYPGGPWSNPGPGWTTFKQDYPLHYNFAKDKIFGGVEY